MRSRQTRAMRLRIGQETQQHALQLPGIGVAAHLGRQRHKGFLALFADGQRISW